GNWFAGELQLLDDLFNLIGPTVSTNGQGQAYTFQGLAPGTYNISRALLGTTELCPNNYLLNIEVPSAGNPCGTVSGTIYLDHDQDCVQDANDEPIPYRVLEILPGPVYTITNALGGYDLGLAYGNFTIDQQNPASMYQVCPPLAQAPFILDSGQPNIVIDFADSSLVPLDVYCMLQSTPLRPGFQGGYYGHVSNNSGQVSGPIAVSFTIPAPLTFVSAEPMPSSVVGDLVTWTDLPPLGGFDQHDIHIFVQVPPDPVLIGTVVTAVLTATQPLPEAGLANNSVALPREITGSYDPNTKHARTSTGESDEQYYIGSDEWIDYTIRFQNTGTDTAFTVTITDTLATELDMARFEQGVASHPFTVSFKSGRVVEWRFDNILLPDSGTNEAGSHGLVSFRIKPMQPLTAGTEIANTANIFFDFNEPVITEPAIFYVETGLSVQQRESRELRTWPNPANGQLMVGSSTGLALGSLSVLDLQGRVVLQLPALTGNLHAVDVTGIAAGTYLLKARTTEGVLSTRFVKQ
ncbi:MAG: T9SS type A sorting domain-containing protein, partial [Flavobacteriales bacterium]